MMTQRSADCFLGLPFNIASTSLLTCILAKMCNMIPKEVIINLGDAHIYSNHIDQVRTQLSRSCLKFPILRIEKDISGINDIEELNFEDFILESYVSHSPIKAEMAI